MLVRERRYAGTRHQTTLEHLIPKLIYFRASHTRTDVLHLIPDARASHKTPDARASHTKTDLFLNVWKQWYVLNGCFNIALDRTGCEPWF